MREKIEWRVIICSACIACGVLLILCTIGLNRKKYFQNKKEVEMFYQECEETQEDTNFKLWDEEYTKNDTDVIAVLKIPTIKCEESVKEGTDKYTLANALGHMKDTSAPGANGNCVIAGHRNYNFGLYFNRLNEVKIDDEIIVDTKEATYTYQVADIKVVDPDDVSVLEETDTSRITLITCTPIYLATNRLIVTGELSKVDLRQ